MRLLSLVLLLAIVGCSKDGPPAPVVVVDPESTPQPASLPVADVADVANGQPQAAPAVEPRTPVGPGLESGGSFAFPGGEAGKRLSDALASGGKVGELDRERRGVRPRVLPSYLNPESGLTVAPEFPARRLSGVAAAPVRPMPTPDRVPVDFSRVDVPLPEMPTFAVGPLMSNPGLDFRLPAPVQTLARYAPERASLEDPTGDFIPAMVVNPALPLKEVVAPFVRLTLPDPFENVGPAQVKNPPKEDVQSALGTTARPR